jgi:hypothetical protein
MPYDRRQLRLERFNAEIGYHAAFNYWNVRGVLAEKWGHGPLFGARAEGDELVALIPATKEPERRVQALYGLGASGVLAEGPEQVEKAREICEEWMADALEVLRPKRVTRVNTQLFALYPTDDPVQSSRRLRSHFYRREALESTLPRRARDQRDKFHSAMDWYATGADPPTSLVAGTLGPPHRGQFFAWPDEERDGRWWMGFNFGLIIRNEDTGIPQPVRKLKKMVDTAFKEIEEVAQAVLEPILK